MSQQNHNQSQPNQPTPNQPQPERTCRKFHPENYLPKKIFGASRIPSTLIDLITIIMKIQNILGIFYVSYRDRSKGIYIITGAPTRERAIAKGLFMVMSESTPHAI